MTTETTTTDWDRMMSAYNAYSRNHDSAATEGLLTEYQRLAAIVRTGECDHTSIEYDETQVDVDRYRTEATGTCDDCGTRVEWVEDWDEDGRTWVLINMEDRT